MLGFLKRPLRYLAVEHNILRPLWVRVARPRGEEYAEWLKRWGGLHSVGEGNCIQISTDIVDPRYVRIGSHCVFSTCALIGHDASVSVINRAFGKRLDAVGKVDIRDNCFIGYGAIILPGVTIGPNAIVAAGAVVNKDVGEGEVVGGIPARTLCKIDDLVHRMEARSKSFPWADLIAKRDGDYDPSLEPELHRLREAYMFGESKP